MKIVTTAQADEQGVQVVDPLAIVDTVEGPYLTTGGFDVIAPPEVGTSPTAKLDELDRWAATRGYTRVRGTNQYRAT